jgi:hypothetical protein
VKQRGGLHGHARPRSEQKKQGQLSLPARAANKKKQGQLSLPARAANKKKQGQLSLPCCFSVPSFRASAILEDRRSQRSLPKLGLRFSAFPFLCQGL